MKPAVFNESTPQLKHEIDIAALIVEIRRYLAAVDAFRREGCELRWQAESRSAL